MTEEESNRRDEILQAALEVFAEVGFAKASIKQIAKRAGLKSPALIYWYFESKEDLLNAVVGMVAPVLEYTFDPAQIVDQPPEQVLNRIGELMLWALENANAGRMFRVFMSEAIHNPESVEQIANSGPLLMLNLLRTYLHHQIDSGQLQAHDPEIVARGFIGTLLIYIMAKEVLPPLSEGLPARDVYVKEIVRVFLKGLES